MRVFQEVAGLKGRPVVERRAEFRLGDSLGRRCPGPSAQLRVQAALRHRRHIVVIVQKSIEPGRNVRVTEMVSRLQGEDGHQVQERHEERTPAAERPFQSWRGSLHGTRYLDRPR